MSEFMTYEEWLKGQNTKTRVEIDGPDIEGKLSEVIKGLQEFQDKHKGEDVYVEIDLCGYEYSGYSFYVEDELPEQVLKARYEVALNNWKHDQELEEKQKKRKELEKEINKLQGEWFKLR